MFDAETHAAMGAALVERGLMTPEAVAADRAAQETQTAGAAEPAEATKTSDSLQPTPAAPSPAADPLDVAIFAPPASQQAYDLSQGPAPQGTEYSSDFEVQNRAALFAAGIPQSIGDHMAKRWNAVMASGELPSDAQLALDRRQATETLMKHWGPAWQENLARARSVVAIMANHQPNIRQMMDVSGLGNDPHIIISLANLARAREPKA